MHQVRARISKVAVDCLLAKQYELSVRRDGGQDYWTAEKHGVCILHGCSPVELLGLDAVVVARGAGWVTKGNEDNLYVSLLEAAG